LARHRVVYLQTGFAAAVRRVGLDTPRPLLLGNPRARMRELLAERLPVYESLARITVITDDRDPQEIADEIAAAVTARIAAGAGGEGGGGAGAGAGDGGGAGEEDDEAAVCPAGGIPGSPPLGRRAVPRRSRRAERRMRRPRRRCGVPAARTASRPARLRASGATMRSAREGGSELTATRIDVGGDRPYPGGVGPAVLAERPAAVGG